MVLFFRRGLIGKNICFDSRGFYSCCCDFRNENMFSGGLVIGIWFRFSRIWSNFY